MSGYKECLFITYFSTYTNRFKYIYVYHVSLQYFPYWIYRSKQSRWERNAHSAPECPSTFTCSMRWSTEKWNTSETTRYIGPTSVVSCIHYSSTIILLMILDKLSVWFVSVALFTCVDRKHSIDLEVLFLHSKIPYDSSVLIAKRRKDIVHCST